MMLLLSLSSSRDHSLAVREIIDPYLHFGVGIVVVVVFDVVVRFFFLVVVVSVIVFT